MLVSEFTLKVISERQYKYQTKQYYIKGIKAIGIWNDEVSSLSPQIFYERSDAIANLNTYNHPKSQDDRRLAHTHAQRIKSA